MHSYLAVPQGRNLGWVFRRSQTDCVWRLARNGTAQVFHLPDWKSSSLEDKTLGHYQYALDSTGMFWAVPVCF